MIDAVWMRIRHFLREEQGPTAVEYAVMLMLIILALITVIQTIGQWTAGSLQNSVDEMNNAMNH